MKPTTSSAHGSKQVISQKRETQSLTSLKLPCVMSVTLKLPCVMSVIRQRSKASTRHLFPTYPCLEKGNSKMAIPVEVHKIAQLFCRFFFIYLLIFFNHGI